MYKKTRNDFFPPNRNRQNFHKIVITNINAPVRWTALISSFDFKIDHVKGTDTSFVLTDLLSRLPSIGWLSGRRLCTECLHQLGLQVRVFAGGCRESIISSL